MPNKPLLRVELRVVWDNGTNVKCVLLLNGTIISRFHLHKVPFVLLADMLTAGSGMVGGVEYELTYKEEACRSKV